MKYMFYHDMTPKNLIFHVFKLDGVSPLIKDPSQCKFTFPMKLHQPLSKIVITFESMMQFLYPLKLLFSLSVFHSRFYDGLCYL